MGGGYAGCFPRDRSRVPPLCVGTLVAVISEDPARRPLTRRERMAIRRRRRRQRRLFAFGGLFLVLAAAFGALQLRQDGPTGTAAAPSTASRPPATTSTPSVTLPPLEAPLNQTIFDENKKPGTGNWRVTKGGAPHDIEGYLNVTSAQRG